MQKPTSLITIRVFGTDRRGYRAQVIIAGVAFNGPLGLESDAMRRAMETQGALEKAGFEFDSFHVES